ncbi:CRISPR-associated protein Csn2-St [Listeria floridensis]|nr:CRISPR-associated protein Csn2-St [Listeria floridensis]
MKIEYDDGSYINFMAYHKNFFMGGCNEKKWKLCRSFERLKSGKQLSIVEENVYGDDGLSFFMGEKRITAKDVDIHIVNSRESIFSALEYKKGSLMYAQMESFKMSFDVNRMLDQLNNELLKIESEVQGSFAGLSDNITPIFLPITFEGLLKNQLLFSYLEKGKIFPLEMMDVGELLDEFCQLLRLEIERSARENWLVLRNAESFIYGKHLQRFMDELEKISFETKLLKIFVISDSYVDFTYTQEDIEKTIILGDQDEQLPPFDVFRKSICNHYPSEFIWSDNQLVSSAFRVFHYLGNERLYPYINEKDMVLLKVVTGLLGMPTLECLVMEDGLNDLERAFLRDKLQKIFD